LIERGRNGGTMAIGKAGAKDAALFAVRILAMEDAGLRKKIEAYSRKIAREVEREHENLKCQSS